MVYRAMAAAELLAEEGISCEVIDPRTLVPFDTEMVVQSVRKTERLVIVDECNRTGGWAGEVAAEIQEKAFGSPGRADPARDRAGHAGALRADDGALLHPGRGRHRAGGAGGARMALRPLSSILRDAAARAAMRSAYFEAWDIYSLEAVVEAAEAQRSPVVIGFGGMMMDQTWLGRYGVEPLGAYGRALRSGWRAGGADSERGLGVRARDAGHPRPATTW